MRINLIQGTDPLTRDGWSVVEEGIIDAPLVYARIVRNGQESVGHGDCTVAAIEHAMLRAELATMADADWLDSDMVRARLREIARRV